MGGGVAVPALLLLAVALGLTGVLRFLTGRELSGARLGLLVLAAQVLLHLLFERLPAPAAPATFSSWLAGFGWSSTAGSGPPSASLMAMGHSGPMSGMWTAAGLGAALPMLAAHLCAALAVTLLLRRAERAVFTVSRLAVAVRQRSPLAAALRLLALRLGALVVQPRQAWPKAGDDVARPVALLPHSIVRRGPPARLT